MEGRWRKRTDRKPSRKKKGSRGRRSRFKRGAKVGKEYCKIAKIGNKPR